MRRHTTRTYMVRTEKDNTDSHSYQGTIKNYIWYENDHLADLECI